LTNSDVSSPPPTPARFGWLQSLDRTMAAGPWLPRVAPFFVWIVLMAIEGQVRTYTPLVWLWPVLYAGKCAVVCWLLWRYRRLISEVNWRFHWTVVPSAVLLLIAWIGLGWLMAGEFGERFSALMQGDPRGTVLPYNDPANVPVMATTEPTFYQKLQSDWPAGFFALGIGLKLVGMAVVVPMFEELFTRSALLRGLNKWRQTKTGLLQIACDLPGIGERLMHARAGEAATRQPPAFTEQLKTTAVGTLGVTGVALSTLLFASWHAMRDWPGALACGLVWCAMVWWTNRGENKLGLGPVIWSHALVNALLWGYTLWSGDWQFL
jgi:hypothetical protein